MDVKNFYLATDIEYFLDLFRTYIAFIERNWNNITGRPTVVFVVTKGIYEAHEALNSGLISTIKKLNSGYLNGARVVLGKLDDFIKTACLTSLNFVGNGAYGEENERKVIEYIDSINSSGAFGSNKLLQLCTKNQSAQTSTGTRKKLGAIIGIAKRSRSITYTDSPMIEETTFDNRHTISYEELDKRPKPDTSFHNMKPEDILALLKETKSLHDEADILHYLLEIEGLEWDIGLHFPNLKLKDLIVDVYEKASLKKMWWLVRHSAGLLGMKSDDLAKSVLTLIVRQKQISIGLPTNRINSEISIKSPLPLDQIIALIKQAWNKDVSMMMLTQELLIYLALFISTEPQLFDGMIRVRVGLIIQVMIGELKRTLNCSVEHATDHLLNLSPYEMKALLHMIISGKELGVTVVHSSKSISDDAKMKLELERRYLRDELKEYSVRSKPIVLTIENDENEEENEAEINKHGQWIRRRLLDGSLNRVPIGFYSKVWITLEKCQGIQINNFVLNTSLTREMTKEELKFALIVEEALNRIPEPEYRQLIVEACMLVTMLAQSEPRFFLNDIINIDKIVEIANDLFLCEQVKHNGDATLCCCIGKRCPGARQICEHFYDLAPSGRYGSMNYLFKGITQLLRIEEKSECLIS